MPLFKSYHNTPVAAQHSNLERDNTSHHRQAKIFSILPLHIKNHLVAAISELIGTFLFLFFGFGGAQAVNTASYEAKLGGPSPNPARLLFIALSFGISLAVNAWVFYRISGGLFNPAVSLAMVLHGAMGILRGIVVVLAQLLGAIAAAAAIHGLLPGPLSVNTSLGGDISVVRGLFLEMFLTAQLVFTIFMLAGEKHRGTFIAPIGIGLSLFIAHLTGVYYTGASLNPARSFGPAVVTGAFPSHHWIYWIGPILGSLAASVVFFFFKAVDYTTVNPLQDAAGESSTAGHGSSVRGINAVEANSADRPADESRAYARGPTLESADGRGLTHDERT